MSTNTVCRSLLRAARSKHDSIAPVELPIPFARIITPSRQAATPTRLRARNTRTYATGATPASSPVPDALRGASAEVPSDKTAAEPKEQTAPDYVETYVANENTEHIFKECARQADYTVPQAFERDGEVPKNAAGEDVGEGTGWWYETLGLTPTFSVWFHITCLHIYLIVVRLRYFAPNSSQIWQQHLTNHLFYEAEHRMALYHKISARGIRNRYLKELYNQWRGVQGAYDEGLVKGDAVLATAIWRNIFKADENVDWRHVAMITSFARRALKGLDGASDETIRKAKVRFSSPVGEHAVVEKEARGLKAGWESSDEAVWKEWEQKKTAAGAPSETK